MKAPLIYLKLVYPEKPKESLLTPEKTWLLSGLSTYKDYSIFGFLAPIHRKAPELGKIFNNINPKKDGNFDLELGVMLPDLLPNLNGKLDYSVEVSNKNDELKLLCLSNQMGMIYYKIDNEQLHALFPRCKLDKLSNNDIKIPFGGPIQLLRTMVTTRFIIKGQCAEDALEENIETCLDVFINLLNKLLISNQMILNDGNITLSTSYDRNSFDFLYLIICGKDKNKFGHGKLALNLGKTAINPYNIVDEKADSLLSFLNGAIEIDEIKHTMYAAKNAIDGGLLKYALIQLVIASEIATADFVKKCLLAKGVSKSKWKDYGKDITYSHMLNLYLWSLTPAHLKPDRDLIGKINRARDCRNDLMHEGIFNLTKNEMRELYEATEEYLGYIQKTRQI